MIRVIPIDSTNESFTQLTSLDGVTYKLAFAWNARAQSWKLDVFADDDTPIARGLRISATWPLLHRIVHARRPPGDLVAIDTTGAGDPGRDDLGTRVVLVYIESETVAELRG